MHKRNGKHEKGSNAGAPRFDDCGFARAEHAHRGEQTGLPDRVNMTEHKRREKEFRGTDREWPL